MSIIITDYPFFFTGTVYKWKPLLGSDRYKDIVLGSLRHLVEQKRILLEAFVIMKTHIHLIWQMQQKQILADVQRDFLKFTAQRMQLDLRRKNVPFLEEFRVNKADREFQFWKRKSLNVSLWSPKVYDQKLNYIHNNPVEARLCKKPEDYLYSSAKFYSTGIDDWGILTHRKGDGVRGL